MTTSALLEKVMKSGEIQFVKPIIGFEASSSYVLELVEEGAPFYWLSSLQDKKLRFIAINVFDFFPDYGLNFKQGDEKVIGCEPAECLVFALVTIFGSVTDATVNLAAPIVINSSDKTGAQIVNQIETYNLRQPLLKKGA
jgi:flagellar assembly factor FliW